MVTTSKRWAIVTGFVFLGVAIVCGAFWSRSYRSEKNLLIANAAAAAHSPIAGLAEVTSVNRAANGGSVPPTAADQTTASASKEAKPKSAAAPSDNPRFDIVRVEPSGETVLAGHGAPNSSVDLMASGRVVAQVSTDADGQFVMLPPVLKPGDYALSLRQPSAGASPAESTQSVDVSVPEKGRGEVIVAMTEPGQPTTLLSPPAVQSQRAAPVRKIGPEGAVQKAAARIAPDMPAMAAAKEVGLAVRSVELENGNGFFASGAAAPGTKLHVYLNNSHLAEVVAGVDGNWSVKIRKGLMGGHYVVRADATAGTTVVARVEVPFDVPTATADANGAPLKEQAAASKSGAAPPATLPYALASAAPVPAASPTPEAPSAAKPSATAEAVIEEVSTAMVHSGDNLWDISRVRLGQGRRYTRIYAANVTQIRNPSRIYPGQVFVLPSRND